MEDEYAVNEELMNLIRGVSVAYIKIMKNTKGYNWEFKVLSNDVKECIELNNKLMEHFQQD